MLTPADRTTDEPPDEPTAESPAVPEAAWRVEVGRFRAEHPQRRFPMGLHVGEPAGGRMSVEVPWPVPEEYDDGLRRDLVTGLVAAWETSGAGRAAVGPAGVGPAVDRRASVWLTRVGVPELHDQDALWHAAAVHAAGALGVRLDAFRVVTKNGWLDVRTGTSRSWKRLRL